MLVRLLYRLGHWVVGRRWLIIVVALLLSGVSAALLPQLDILTARTALYPTDLEVNQRFQAFLDEFGTTGALIAVVEGEPDVIGLFADDLACELDSETEVVESVFYKADLEFFARRAFLYVTLEQMEMLRERVMEHRDEIRDFGRINGLLPLLEKFSQADAATALQQNIDIPTAKRILATAEELFDEIEAWLRQPDRTEIKLLEKLFADEMSGRNIDPEGYLRSHDRRLVFLFVQPTSNSDEFTFIDNLVTRSRAAVERTTSAWRAAGKEPPAVGFTGLPANGVEENIAIKRDVVFTAVVAAVLILFIILIGFRSVRRGIIVFIPLVLAGLWNLGLSALTVGHLTLLTSGFTAVLFGLGVDYGIFISGRIEEEQRKGHLLAEAIAIALSTSGRTLLAAGGTTAVAFFIIGTVDFTGFAELGVVAGSGVVLVMLATLFVLPALTAITRPPVRCNPTPDANPVLSDNEAASKGRKKRSLRLLPRRPPLVFTGLVAIVALVLGGLSIRSALTIPIDFDVASIMPRDSESMHYQHEMATRSDFQPEFVALIAANLEEARAMTSRLKKLETVSRVESITDVLPENQERKVEIIREVASIFDKISIAEDDFAPYTGEDLAEVLETLTDMVAESQEKAFTSNQKDLVVGLDRVMDRLEGIAEKVAESPQALERMRALEKKLFSLLQEGVRLTRDWGTTGPLRPEDLPDSVRTRFQGSKGRYVIYAFPAESVYDLDFLDRFLGEIYSVSPTATGFPTGHQVFSRLIMTGFKQATFYAIIVVFLLLFLEFRHLGYALAALLPLSLGGAWMFGILHVLKIPLNYANIIAFPLVIGLAVDYGVYLSHRLRENKGRNPFVTMQYAAKPVILAALTTVAGIGAICLGEHRGAASLGEALIYGIISCLIAAVIVLPCIAAAVQDLGGRRKHVDDKTDGATDEI
jgi:uncharacterized protein